MENDKDLQWKRLIHDFKEYLTFISPKDYDQKSVVSYMSYLNSLNKANDGQTVSGLNEALKVGNPKEVLSYKVDGLMYDKAAKTISNWKSALNRLADYVFGFVDADINLKSIRDFDLLACKLVAQSAIFCSKEVFDAVVNGEIGAKENIDKGNDYGSWFNCRYKRVQRPNKRGDEENGVKLDDNTYANNAIKSAVLAGLKIYGIDPGKIKFYGYEACHIWPRTCYNEKYHTSVANLVLLPREIAGLTDHCKAVEDLLKYEAFNRFRFKPDPEDINPGEDISESAPPYYKDLVWRPTLEIDK